MTLKPLSSHEMKTEAYCHLLNLREKIGLRAPMTPVVVVVVSLVTSVYQGK